MLSKIQALGAAVLVGAGASTALATQIPSNFSMDQSSHVEQQRGALQSVLPPRYDGPVMWESISSGPTQSQATMIGVGVGGALGVVVGFFGGAIAEVESSNDKKSYLKRGLAIGTLSGTLLGGGIGFATASEPLQVISFGTRVQEVIKSEPSHAEERVVHTGKTSHTIVESPFYSQIVSIPETDLLLGSNSYRAPLIPGEKINASFFIDHDGHIISWVASPGPR